MHHSTTALPVFGCDVGQDSLVVYNSHNGHFTDVNNRPKALAAFVATLPTDCLVVCEATGGHETALLDATLAAGIAAHRADARKVKAFIRSLGHLAKTDRIDAQGLARYGQERATLLPRWQAVDPQLKALQALVRLRRELIAQRKSHRQRLTAPGADLLRTHLSPLMGQIDQTLAEIEAEIKTLIAHTASFQQRCQIIQHIKGCGPAVATTLIALLPELGHLNRRAIASLAGLAPHPRQSGKSDRYRCVRGGRPEVRHALFMAALTASRYNPQLRDFYQRLVARGKKKILALTAVMRKLVTIINARIRDGLLAAQLPPPQLS